MDGIDVICLCSYIFSSLVTLHMYFLYIKKQAGINKSHEINSDADRHVSRQTERGRMLLCW